MGKNDKLDEEWISLIMEARNLGLTKEEVRAIFIDKKDKVV